LKPTMVSTRPLYKMHLQRSVQNRKP
jgi:hypothetical protein